MKRIALSKIFGNWQGSLVQPAFEKLCRGIEKENERFKGSSFIVLCFRQEYDYDGLNEYLDLLDGFADKKDAFLFAAKSCDHALREAITQPSYGNYQWCADSTQSNKRFVPGYENQWVKCVYLQSFKVANGSGYDFNYYQFEVLQIDSPQVVGEALFSYLQQKSEWVSYLIDKGQQ